MKIKVPSKTFLWGEYAALVGGVGGLLTHGPYFELEVYDNPSPDELKKNLTHINSLFHFESPAGRTLELDRSRPLYCKFHDPYDLSGGFGRSTAEWIGAKAINLKSELEDFEALFKSEIFKTHSVSYWKEYRDLFTHFKKSPSGYDLLAQLNNTILLKTTETVVDQIESQTGHVTLVDGRGDYPKILSNGALSLNLGVLVFKTKIKVKTHEHLEALGPESLDYVKALSADVAKAYISKDVRTFIVAQKAFDAELRRLHFITLESAGFCDEISKLEGVLHARGCGALGADVIAVFYEPGQSKDLISEITDTLDLIFIADVKGID